MARTPTDTQAAATKRAVEPGVDTVFCVLCCGGASVAGDEVIPPESVRGNQRIRAHFITEKRISNPTINENTKTGLWTGSVANRNSKARAYCIANQAPIIQKCLCRHRTYLRRSAGEGGCPCSLTISAHITHLQESTPICSHRLFIDFFSIQLEKSSFILNYSNYKYEGRK